MASSNGNKSDLALDDGFSAIAWRDNKLVLLDQRRLPAAESYLELTTVADTARAIADMVVRGAPAIGITAAFGAVLSLQQRVNQGEEWRHGFARDMAMLEQSRPTAINLRWAIRRMTAQVQKSLAQGLTGSDLLQAAISEARSIHDEDIAANRKMGELGAELIDPCSGILTHCNTGGLATGGIGTALGVIRAAHALGRLSRIFASETRPWLQGARLTAWELQKAHIDAQLVVEGASAALMRDGAIDWVIVGADRIAANGDVANKIGTYAHAVSAHHHGVKFMVVAPLSTIDWNTARGADIPIEQRASSEITRYQDKAVAPQGFRAWNPAFDVTPASLVSAIVTEAGVVKHPDAERMRAVLQKSAD